MNIGFFKNASRKVVALSLVSMLALAAVITSVTIIATRDRGIKNIILMIPDGMSMPATTLARFMRPDNPSDAEEDWTFTGQIGNLELDNHFQARMRTAWAGGPITDSAPAGTAMATGRKSNNLRVGLDQNDDPRANVMQAARSIGKSTGLVMTSEFMHATPAAFASHDVARFNYETLARQILGNRPNVVLGTGSAQVRSHNEFQRGYPETVRINNLPGAPVFSVADILDEIVPDFEVRDGTDGTRRIFRTDLPVQQAWGPRLVDADGYTLDSRGGRIMTRNTWMQNVADEGYQVVRTRSQMNALRRPTSSNASDLRVWGDFNGGLSMLGENYRYLSFDMDRQFRPDLDEPSLADMTRVAIDLLSSNPNGFFLVVEGSKIDWAAHSHDTVAMMGDILAFDDAFSVAVDFARRCGNTIVISASDHATGGLTIGSSDLGFDAGIGGDSLGPWTFDEAPWEMLYPLRRAVTGRGSTSIAAENQVINNARSSEAALQLFVHPYLEGARHLRNFSGSAFNYNDWASNHNDVLRAYGINVDFYDTMVLKTNQDITYYLEYHNIVDTPAQIRRVHQLIEEFRNAHAHPNAGNPLAAPNPSSQLGPLTPFSTWGGNGMQNLSTAELQNAQRRLARIMNQINYISWSTNWHAGDEVGFYMYAPAGFSHIELLGRDMRIIDNTDVAIMLANAMRICLDSLTNDLFVEVFDGMRDDGKESVRAGISVTLIEAEFQLNLSREGAPDGNNSSNWHTVTFTLQRGGNVVTVTSNRNYFYLGERRIQLDLGVVVYLISKPQFAIIGGQVEGVNVETGRLFVPRQIIRALG